jgi:hypothetical protein
MLYVRAMTRNVTLVLVDLNGAVSGALPSFSVSTPWWQVVDEVVDKARTLYGLEVSVLRLLTTDRPREQGGEVSYAAELHSESLVDEDRTLRLLGVAHPEGVPLHVVPPDAARELGLATHPLRAAWARPGGPSCSIAWARGVLLDAGRGPHIARQCRTWNLSSIWRLDPLEHRDGATPVWLKQVPPFFAHEGAVLEWLHHVAPTSSPSLIASGPEGRLLLDHVPGEDRHDAPVADREAFGRIAHAIQLAACDATIELTGRGVPDRRGRKVACHIRTALADATSHAGLDWSIVAELLDVLEPTVDALEECGFPDTLVHGDLHSGNVRSHSRGTVIIDWGDAFVGHPGFDILRLTEDLEREAATPILASWSSRWRRDRPQCDPERALALLRPLAALYGAAGYSGFVANIEPSERVYHIGEITSCLEKARRLVRGSVLL